jgi:quercetin dioxygenase-like cupin family protein
MSKQAMIVKSGHAPALNVLGTQVRFLCEGHSTSDAWSLMELVVPKDGGPPLHHHAWDEAYYITAGEVCFLLGAESFIATPGDFVYAPGGVRHGFRGASDHDARMLIFDAPAHAGAFFRRVDREVKEMPRDLPKVLDIGNRTGIHFATVLTA